MPVLLNVYNKICVGTYRYVLNQVEMQTAYMWRFTSRIKNTKSQKYTHDVSHSGMDYICKIRSDHVLMIAAT